MSALQPATPPQAKGSLVLLPAIAAMVFVVCMVIGVMPAARQIDSTRAEIAGLEADLRQQQALQPVYQSLEKRKQQSLPEGIHVFKREPLKIDDLAALPDVFEGLARKSKVQLISATPQVRSLRDGRELLRVDTRMRGGFQAFNTLLNRLNEMPSLEAIESLSVDVTESGHELQLSVWLAIR